MANNVEATAGSGTTFKTTDNAGVHTGHVNVDAVPQAVQDALDAIETATEALSALIDSGALLTKLDPTTVNANGRATEANSAPVALSDEDFASLQAIETATEAANTSLTKPLAGHYETIAASQTDQMMGATGAAGDYLAGVLIIPATTSPGAVSIEDGATNITIFTGGADSVTNLVPFMVPLGIYSVSGGWEITTGTNVSAIAVGSFTA